MLVRLRVLNDDFTLYKYAISSTQQDTTRNKNPNRYFFTLDTQPVTVFVIGIRNPKYIYLVRKVQDL